MINLYLNERRAGAVTILDLKGRVRVGGNTVGLHKSIVGLLQEKRMQILLDLAGVTYIDSIGLGEIVASRISAETKGGAIKLVGLSELLRELLRVTRLETVLDIYESEAEALQAFAEHVSTIGKPQLSFV